MRKFFISISIICFGLFSTHMLSAASLNAKEDRQTSPYTGYTRAHWLEINEQLIAGALNYVNPETGIFSLPESTGAYRELEDFRNENQARIMERSVSSSTQRQQAKMKFRDTKVLSQSLL